MTLRGTVAKGAALRATLAYVLDVHGAARYDTLVATLPVERRAGASEGDGAAELPYEVLHTLWHAADDLLRERDPSWAERAGAYSIASSGAQLYGGILRKRSPHEFLTQSVSLFQLYYAPGNMQVVEEEGSRAVLRLDGFDSRSALFCRRQNGGLTEALRLAAATRPVVRHVRCVHEGDAFCEWELLWGDETPPADSLRPGTGPSTPDA